MSTRGRERRRMGPHPPQFLPGTPAQDHIDLDPSLSTDEAVHRTSGATTRRTTYRVQACSRRTFTWCWPQPRGTHCCRPCSSCLCTTRRTSRRRHTSSTWRVELSPFHSARLPFFVLLSRTCRILTRVEVSGSGKVTLRRSRGRRGVYERRYS